MANTPFIAGGEQACVVSGTGTLVVDPLGAVCCGAGPPWMDFFVQHIPWVLDGIEIC